MDHPDGFNHSGHYQEHLSRLFMQMRTLAFEEAYASYYQCIQALIKPGMNVLEIGGGHHPSFQNWDHFEYTIIDPDPITLKACPEGIKTINSTVELVKLEKKFDLVISKMVLEHIENPKTFHQKVKDLVHDNGHVVHFFACRNSLPSTVNRLLPEWMSERILKALNNRALDDTPKYQAYYQMVDGYTQPQISFFKSLGYTIQRYDAFVGHKYFKKVPILKKIERWYSNKLLQKEAYHRATVALLWMQPMPNT